MAFALSGAAMAQGAKVHTALATKPKVALVMTAPPGFEDLSAPQQVMLDVYMGGRRVGEAAAVVEPGHFRFVDAARLVDLLPDIADRPRLIAALGAPDLDPHPEAVCPPAASSPCPRPAPDVAAIVYDAARYRVDVLVDPRFLTVKAGVRLQYLPLPPQSPGLINFVSGTVSGTSGQTTQYFVQDTAVVGVGSGRLRANFQQSSDSGFQTDTLVGELDRPGLRYKAGAFWIPGNVLLDRIKMVGLGLGTQFDTRLDRDQLAGSPLILFLDQRSRVDIVVDGHVMASQVYDAGNQALDTSGLPEGSYTVTLRVTTATGTVRQEQRFFSRSGTLPSSGHDTFFAYAGALVRNSRGLVGEVSRTPLFQAGWAHRLRTGLAVNLGVIGTDRRQWVAAGGTVLHAGWRLDASVDLSNRGGLGLYGHLARTGAGRFSLDLDARHVSNPGGGPLLPSTAVVQAASGGLEYTPYLGSYSQFSGTVGYAIGQGRLALVGTYRQQAGRQQKNARDYSLGPSLYMPLAHWQSVALDFNGTYSRTSTGPQGYFGLSLRITGPRTSYTVNGGGQFAAGDKGAGGQAQGGFDVSRRFDDVLGAQVQTSGGLYHANGASYAQAQVQARSAVGDGNLNFVQPFAGGASQFAASLRTALVAGQGGVHLNAGGNGDSMLVVHVDADSPDADFDVLVDNRAVGTAQGGGNVTLSLPSYRAYSVRLRSRGQTLSDYDGHAREVSLYPGSVARLDWRARQVTAVFGRLVRPDGTPLAYAEISAGSDQSPGDLAQSNGQGHFLIQTSQGATLTVRTRSGPICKVTLGAMAPVAGYAMVGDLTCRPVAPAPTDFALSSPSTQPKASP